MSDETKNLPAVVEEPKAPAMKRFQLLVRAHLDGALREAGYITTKAADWIGPHRTVVASDHGANIGHGQGDMIDHPLYVEVPDETVPDKAKGAD